MPFGETRPRAGDYRPPANGYRRTASDRYRPIAAWIVDLCIFTAFACAEVYVAGRGCRVSYWLDFVRDTLPLLGALIALNAVVYSFVFVTLGGRTPGMAVAGLHVVTLQGDRPTPRESLVRAVLSVPSAALGVFGFLLALFDARGQTLHDKLCRCVVRID